MWFVLCVSFKQYCCYCLFEFQNGWKPPKLPTTHSSTKKKTMGIQPNTRNNEKIHISLRLNRCRWNVEINNLCIQTFPVSIFVSFFSSRVRCNEWHRFLYISNFFLSSLFRQEKKKRNDICKLCKCSVSICENDPINARH